MSLREEIAGTELKTVRKIQACGNDAAAMVVLSYRDSEIINKVLDRVEEAVEDLNSGRLNDYHDRAISQAVIAINKLRPEK